MGEPAKLVGKVVEFNGARFGFCCGGCETTFSNNAQKYIASAKQEKRVIGAFLFDPTTGMRIEPKNAKGSTDYAGLRYWFSTADGMKAFNANPGQYVLNVKSETLTCPVSGKKLASYHEAGGYKVYEGVAYYFCCGDCMATFGKDPGKFVAKSKSELRAPQAVITVVKG
jgi:YHS domain-containing protein